MYAYGIFIELLKVTQVEDNTVTMRKQFLVRFPYTLEMDKCVEGSGPIGQGSPMLERESLVYAFQFNVGDNANRYYRQQLHSEQR